MSNPLTEFDKNEAASKALVRYPDDFTQLRIMSMEMALRIQDQRHYSDVIQAAQAIEKYIKGGDHVAK